MKKFLALILISVSVLSASAQMLKSRTLMKRENPTMWFVRLGMQVDNLTGLSSEWKDAGYSLSSKVGMDLDFGFNKPICKSGVYWGMDLGVVTRGGSVNYEEDGYDYKVKLTSWSAKYTPLMFGYKYSVTDDLKIDAHLSAYVLYDFSQDGSSDNDEDYDLDRYFENSYDVGIQFGVGAWYKKLNIDFSYQRGFIDYIYTGGYSDESYLKSSAFVIRLGYAF